MWGDKPWDNDAAADWFANLMHNTNFPEQIRMTLLLCEQGDAVGEDTAVLRAAVYCILQFCHVYVWPVDQIDKDLNLAIKAIHKILSDENYCYSEKIVAEIKAELKELESRRKK